MRIRLPWLPHAVGWGAPPLLRWWINTLEYEYRPLGPNVDPNRPDLQLRYIYAMWHEYMLLPILSYARPDIHALISRSQDGELIASLCRGLKIPVIQGSTSRGGVEAVRQLLRAGKWTHLAITPDGPRGPRQRVQQGIIYLAARTGLPIVPVGFGLERPWRLGSWDRFALPRPWTRSRCVTGLPISIPPEVAKDDIEAYRATLDAAMATATELAEEWAVSGVWPEDLAAARTADRPGRGALPAGRLAT